MSVKNFYNEMNDGCEETELYNEKEVNSAMKAFLIENELDNGKSIFSHLIDCVKKIFEERPNNPLDIFENYSKTVKDKTIKNDKQIQDMSINIGLADIQRELFSRGEGDEEEGVPEDDIESPLPNMMLTVYFFEQAGLAMNREEIYRVFLSMKKLVNTQPVEKARFWGKIFGLYQNYYVAEVEFREGEELEEEEEEEPEEAEDERNDSREEDEDEPEDLPPKSNWKKPPTVPKEEFRTGTNKKIYFVCNEPGKSWVRLPHVTPTQIQVARKTKKFFTGMLDAEVKSYPPFPGLEINLLRAQIARISAGTQISPIGFYTFDNEGEEEEEAIQDNYIENTDYAPLHVKELADQSFSNWVHHTNHILPQGRTVWWNPVQRNEEEQEEEAEEEAEEATVEAERGPALLTPISQDFSIEGLKPWSVRISSLRIPEYAIVVISSNLWPGAHAFSFGKHFDNIYIGWGYKQNQSNFLPFPSDQTLKEYIGGGEIIEKTDPTPEEEGALKLSKMEQDDEQEDVELEEEELE